MTFKSSAQSIPFKKRVAQDNSESIKQKAIDAAKNNQQLITNEQRRGSQVVADLNRRAGIQASNDALELTQLKQLSSSILNTIDAVNKNVVKDHIESERNIGLNKAMSGELGMTAEQNQELDDLVRDQKKKAQQIGNSNGESTKPSKEPFDEDHFRESFRNQVIRQNIRKLGMNQAYGARRGLLIEQSQNYVPWFHNRTSSANDDQTVYTLNNGKEVKSSDFSRLVGDEKYNLEELLAREYINQNTFGFNDKIVSQYLTGPIAENRAKLKKEIFELERAQQSQKERQVIKQGIYETRNTYKTDGTVSIKSKIADALTLLAGTYIGEGITPYRANQLALTELSGWITDITVQSETEDYDTEFTEAVFSVLNNEEFDLPGHGKVIPGKFWPDHFNTSKLRSEHIAKKAKKLELKNKTQVDTIKVKIAGINQIMDEAYNNPDVGEKDRVKVRSQQTNSLRELMQTKEFKENEHVRTLVLQALSYEPQIKTVKGSREFVKRIKGLHGGFVPTKYAPQIAGPVLKELIKDGTLRDETFAGIDRKGSEGNLLIQSTFKKDGTLLSTLKAIHDGDKSPLMSSVWDPQNKNETSQGARRALLSMAKTFYVDAGGNYDEPDDELMIKSLKQAESTLKLRIQADNGKGENPSKWNSSNYSDGENFEYDVVNNVYKNYVPKGTDIGLDANQEAVLLTQLKRQIEQDSTGQQDFLAQKLKIEPGEFKVRINANGEQVLPVFWEKLSEIDPLRFTERDKYTLFEQQAALHGIKIEPWNEQTQKIINARSVLTPQQRQDAASGTKSAERVAHDGGVIVPRLMSGLLTNQQGNAIPILPSSLTPLMISEANLPKNITHDELKNNPELLQRATLYESNRLTKVALKKTRNTNQLIRMVYTGLIKGESEMNNWNTRESAAALQGYLSGDLSELLTSKTAYDISPIGGLSPQGQRAVDLAATAIQGPDALTKNIETLKQNEPDKFKPEPIPSKENPYYEREKNPTWVKWRQNLLQKEALRRIIKNPTRMSKMDIRVVLGNTAYEQLIAATVQMRGASNVRVDQVDFARMQEMALVQMKQLFPEFF